MIPSIHRLLLAGILAAALAGACPAATYYVAPTGLDSSPGTSAQPFRTIQKGVNVANAGDTVLVQDGTYTPAAGSILNINGKDVTVQSINGPQHCILDVTGYIARPAQITGVTPNCVIDGFTFRGGIIAAGAGGAAGGGMTISNASPSIRNCIIRDNTGSSASGDAAGGGVLITQGSPVFTNCQIINNEVDAAGNAFGGGVLCDNSSPTFRDCVIANNTVTAASQQAYGGGLQAQNSGTVTLLRTTVSNNAVAVSSPTTSSLAYGGGVRNLNATVSLVRSTVSGNTASADSGIVAGAGVYCQASASVDRCTVTGNQALGTPSTVFGAGIYAVAGTLNVSDTTVSNNTSGNVAQSSVAGGIGIAGPVTATLLRCTVSGNSLASSTSVFTSYAGPQGAGVSNAGTLTMSGCTLQGNTVHAMSSSFGNGGGFCQQAGTSVVHNCLFLGNVCNNDHVTKFGGGAYVSGGTTAFANCAFIGNQLGGSGNGGGGGLACRYSGANVTLANCVFYNNNTGSDSGSLGGGAITAWDGTNVRVQNSILRADSAPTGAEIETFSSTLSLAYSDVQGGIPSGVTNGGHNIDADPKFVRAPFTNGAEDYGDLHLIAGSPCINTGSAAAPGIAAYDLDGFPRNEGGAPDMGVYETHQGSSLVYDIYVDQTAGNDANAGTPVAPVKTVTRALALTDPLGYAHITVKQGNYGTDTPHVNGKVQFYNWTDTGRASIGKP